MITRLETTELTVSQKENQMELKTGALAPFSATHGLEALSRVAGHSGNLGLSPQTTAAI